MNIELNEAEVSLICSMLENCMESSIYSSDSDDIDETQRDEFAVAVSLYEKLSRNS